MKAADITPEQLPELRRKERMKGLPDAEVVQLWYRASDADTWELTPRQEQMRLRMDYAKALFLKRKKYNDIAEALVAEFGVGIATARHDLKAVMKVFGELDQVPKEAHRARAIEMALDAFNMAKKAKDPDGMAKATKNYILATGIDKDDPDAPDLEKMMKERYYAEVFDPILRDLLLKFVTNSGGTMDMTKLFEAVHGHAEDATYEELPNDAGTDQG